LFAADIIFKVFTAATPLPLKAGAAVKQKMDFIRAVLLSFRNQHQILLI